ncbi:MAG TPA: ATP-binding protein [Candidatus Solibacter sp.]|nr:ATP-binding protein [Candidatus Solibacter sp.]
MDGLRQIKARSLAQILLENIQLQQELRRLRMSGVHAGGLTSMEDQVASLAHEIKQPISAATVEAGSCLSFLQPDRLDLQQAREAATMMIVATKRAADIVDRMRSLYRRETFKRRAVNVNDMICAIVTLLSDLAATNSVSIHTELDPALPMGCADFVQLQQVLINLMTNGIEAMRDTGGALTVTSERVDDGYILIAVSDQGAGLPPGGTDQIFEAFFTTKPEGTGLGLSISRTIVELHGGRLWAGTNVAQGSIFQFTLPADSL